MLILTRKEGQKIQIGPDITITLVEIQRGSRGVRLGIDAPRDVMIERDNAKNKEPRK